MDCVWPESLCLARIIAGQHSVPNISAKCAAKMYRRATGLVFMSPKCTTGAASRSSPHPMALCGIGSGCRVCPDDVPTAGCVHWTLAVQVACLWPTCTDGIPVHRLWRRNFRRSTSVPFWVRCSFSAFEPRSMSPNLQCSRVIRHRTTDGVAFLCLFLSSLLRGESPSGKHRGLRSVETCR